ncbi:DNA repair protein RadC [Urechidicola sp. KH5]
MKYPTDSFSIKQWKEDDRPREKLMTKGRQSLSDTELLAILIGSGSRNESAVSLSKRILLYVQNNLNELAKLNVDALKSFKGIGDAKAIAIITALELGRRRRLETALEQPVISSSKSAFEILQPLIADLEHEEFWVLFLNNSNKVIDTLQMSKGGLTGTVVDTRLIFKKALANGSTSLILGHNHPSGSLKPSASDKQLTEKIKHAGSTLDIKVLDHLIVTPQNYYSFADEGSL